MQKNKILLIIGIILWTEVLGYGQAPMTILNQFFEISYEKGMEFRKKHKHGEAAYAFRAARYCLLPDDENFISQTALLDQYIIEEERLYREELEKQRDFSKWQHELADSLARMATRDAVFIRSLLLSEKANQFLKKDTITAIKDALGAAFMGLESIRKHNQKMITTDTLALVIDSSSVLLAFNNAVYAHYNQQKKAHQIKNDHVASIISFIPTEIDSLFITIGRDSTIGLWTVSGELLFSKKNKKDYFLSACLSSNGQYLLATSRDSAMFLWNIETLIQTTFPRQQGVVIKAAFFEKDEKIISIARAKEHPVIIWNIKGKPIDTIALSDWTKAPFVDLLLSPDKTKVMVRSVNQIYSWDTNRFQLNQPITAKSFIYKATFNSKNDIVYNSQPSSVTNIFLSETDTFSFSETNVFRNHKSIITHRGITSVAYLESDGLLLTGDKEGIVRLWSTGGTLLLEQTLKKGGAIMSVAFLAGKMVITNHSGTLYLTPLPNRKYQQLKREGHYPQFSESMHAEIAKIDLRTSK